MKNIHLLPTDKSIVNHKKGSICRYVYNNRKNQPLLLCANDCFETGSHYQFYNTYITSDAEIKEGTIVKIPCGVGKVKELLWKYGNDNPSYLVEDLFTYKLRYGQKEGELQINSFKYEDVKKIILTTDQDLIKEGIQEIDEEFLEWFVDNASCEKVEIKHIIKEYVDEQDAYGYDVNYYKIIIPKPPKYFFREELSRILTTEEVMENRSNAYEFLNFDEEIVEVVAEKFKDLPMNISTSHAKQKAVELLKWQAEKSYSEKEVLEQLNLLYSMKNSTVDTFTDDDDYITMKWFNENKK